MLLINMRSALYLMMPLLVLLFSACTDNGNPANSEKPPCPPLRIVAIAPYSQPVWHPSGQFIAFNHTPLARIDYPYGEHCQGQYTWKFDSTGFWFINADGTNRRRILPYALGEPAWSADGQRIAFGADAQIFKMRFTGTAFDTTTIVQLTTVGRNFFPAWGPDGEWIAYSNTISDSIGVWISPTDGSGARIYFAFGGQPDWFLDGERLLYGNRGIWIEKLDHSSKTPIYADSINGLGGFKISSDGMKIAFASKPSEGLGDIWIINADGTNLQQLTTQGTTDWLSWSPDGKSIAYVSYRATDWTYANGTIWIINVETGAKRQLTFNRPSNN